jgi:drug/metabolite transporter (DMT)-like permease
VLKVPWNGGKPSNLYNLSGEEIPLRGFGVFTGLAAASIWGGMYVVSKVVLEVIPPFTLLSVRLLLGILSLAVFLPGQGGLKWPLKRLLAAFLAGFIGYGISLGLQFVGTHLSTAANAALVTSVSPVFILIFGIWILGEKASVSRVAALILSSVGVIVVLNPRSVFLGGDPALGNIALLGASLTWGLYSVLVKKVGAQMTTVAVSFIAFLGGLPMCLPLSAFEISNIGIGQITVGVLLGVLYLGVISTGLAMYLWNKSLNLLDAGMVSLLFFAQPVVGVGLGMMLLGEELNLGFWIGALLIGGGLLVAARAESKDLTAGS